MYGLDYSSSSPDRWLPSLNLHTFPGQDTENYFIGQHGVQGDPATVVDILIPTMKHCPANLIASTANSLSKSTDASDNASEPNRRVMGAANFLAVPVLDESQSVPDSQSDMQERAQASTTRTSEAQAMDNRPATTGTDRTPAAARNYTFQADSLSLTGLWQ